MSSPAITTADNVPALSVEDTAARRRLGVAGYYACFKGIVWREVLRYLHQRERFLSALVRPLIWLFIFAAGFRQTLGVSIIPPYETYVLYEEFIAPGLIAMILLFNAMQSSLSMVYDRETGTMRTLLVSPFPRSFLLLSKLFGGVSVALLQSYAFVFVAYFWGIQPPPITQVKLFTFYDAPAWLGGVFGDDDRPDHHAAVLSAGVAAAVCRIPDPRPGADPGGADARVACPLHVVGHPPAREFRRRDELRHFPDVLRIFGALPAVADPRGEPAPL